MMNKEQELRSCIGGTPLQFSHIKNCIAYYHADSNILGRHTEVKINLKDIPDNMELDRELNLVFNVPITFQESSDCCSITYKG